MTSLERFLSKIARVGDCWIWQGATFRGYGQFWFGPDRRTGLAHRWAYLHFTGPIPEDLVLDHVCRNRACVNPSHLEPVTNRENGRRGLNGILRTHCPQGHEYTSDNSFINRKGHRECRICRRENRRVEKAHLRERRAA